MSYEDLKPIDGEYKYVEFDDDFDCWAIFGSESGYCYGQYNSREQAEKNLKGLFEDD